MQNEQKPQATKSLRGAGEIPQSGRPRQAGQITASARKTSFGKDGQTIGGVMAKVHFIEKCFCHGFGLPKLYRGVRYFGKCAASVGAALSFLKRS